MRKKSGNCTGWDACVSECRKFSSSTPPAANPPRTGRLSLVLKNVPCPEPCASVRRAKPARPKPGGLAGRLAAPTWLADTRRQF
jgi:hypothetical protein